MNRIDKKFEELKKAGRKGLVTFITAGDPNAEKSTGILQSLPGSGADFIEIGMPFSDPMADGPAIQASSIRALKGGMTLKGVLKIVEDFRAKNSDTPIILMGYFNPIYVYGCEAFAKEAAEAGVDGLIIVDTPPEEDEEIRLPAQKEGLHMIRLVTPTTDSTRLPKVLEGAGGFLYYVSIMGITGTKSANVTEVAAHINEIKAKTDLPIAIGFGIKTPEDVKTMSAAADAVVVGSAIVQNIADHQSDNDLPARIGGQVKELVSGL